MSFDSLKAEIEQITDRTQKAERMLKLLDEAKNINSREGEPYIAQLKEIGEASGDARYIAYALYHRANLLRLDGRFEDALKLLSEALNQFELLAEDTGRAECYQLMGITQSMFKNQVEAIQFSNKAIAIWKQLNNKKNIASCLNTMGNAYLFQNKYTEAMDHFLAALELHDETGNVNGMATVYSNIGLIEQRQGLKDSALKNYELSLELRMQTGDLVNALNTTLNLAGLLRDMKRGEEAVSYYDKGIALAKQTQNKRGLANAYSSLGSFYHDQKDYHKALSMHLEALTLSQSMGNEMQIAHGLLTVGANYHCLQQHEEATRYLHEGLKVAEKTSDKSMLRMAYNLMYETNKENGNLAEALHYHELHTMLDRKLRDEQIAMKIEDMKYQYQLDKKQQEYDFEHHKREELELAYTLLEKEKQRSDELLLNILPAEVAEELKEKGYAQARYFDEVTVLFADFKSFTNISEKLTPQQLVDELHECFSAFDTIVGKYKIEKIKTVGDCYVAVAGLPMASPTHAIDMVSAALEVRDFINSRAVQKLSGLGTMRIGLHSGSVVAGIVGIKKFAYDIWGDTVNTAARMEQNGVPGFINISKDTYERVKRHFRCEYRGKIEAKNKGEMEMYFVHGKK